MVIHYIIVGIVSDYLRYFAGELTSWISTGVLSMKLHGNFDDSGN